MNGNGKAGNGRGNNRKRPFKRWDRDNTSWQDKESNPQGNGSSLRNVSPKVNDNTYRNRNFHKGAGGEPRPYRTSAADPGGMYEKRTQGREHNSENQGRQNRGNLPKKNNQNPSLEKAPFIDRPKWVPPVINTDPLPAPACFWCGKPIRDISTAIADKDTGNPVHFDCVTARIALGENLDKGDKIIYIGGGRFGIVNYENLDSHGKSAEPAHTAGSEGIDWNRDFKIKRVIEWESKDKRAVWRSAICDQYSVT